MNMSRVGIGDRATGRWISIAGRIAVCSVGVDFRLDEFTVSIIKTVNSGFEDALGLEGIAISLDRGRVGETITVLGGLVGRLRVIVASLNEAGVDTRGCGCGRELIVLSALVIGLRLRVGSEIADVLGVGVRVGLLDEETTPEFSRFVPLLSSRKRPDSSSIVEF